MARYRSFGLLLVAIAAGYLLFISENARQAVAGTATALFRPLIVELVTIIVEPAFVYVSAALMFLAAVLICIAYWFRIVRPTLRSLRHLASGVTRLRLPEARRPEERHEALKALGDLLRNQRMYLAAWALFQSNAAATGRMPEHPFAYFAASDPDTEMLERRGFMAALPGYFTSIGLLLTFLGLVVALYFAAKGFKSGNLDEAREAIQQLLNASAFKFVTSVAALGCALLISVVHRLCQSILRSESARTIATIEAYISALRDIERVAIGSARITETPDKVDLAAAMATLTAEMKRLSARLEPKAGSMLNAG